MSEVEQKLDELIAIQKELVAKLDLVHFGIVGEVGQTLHWIHDRLTEFKQSWDTVHGR